MIKREKHKNNLDSLFMFPWITSRTDRCVYRVGLCIIASLVACVLSFRSISECLAINVCRFCVEFISSLAENTRRLTGEEVRRGPIITKGIFDWLKLVSPRRMSRSMNNNWLCFGDVPPNNCRVNQDKKLDELRGSFEKDYTFCPWFTSPHVHCFPVG